MKEDLSSSESMDSSYTTPTNPKTSHFTSWANWSILFFFIAGIICLSLLSSNSIFQSHQCPQPFSNKSELAMQKDELEETLEKASMENKTVIIAVVNKAYIEEQEEVGKNMLDMFLEGFWVGEGTRELLNHLIIVAVDQTAYDRCIFRGVHCYRLLTDGADFTEEKVFMSDDFIKMMWSRTLFLLQVLNKGYNFIFTDTDVIWLRNPFTILTTNETQDMDIQFSIDHYNGNSSSLQNPINTGFYFVKSNNKTISLFHKWYTSKDNFTGLKEQDVLQHLVFKNVLDDLGLKARFLNTRFFSGFCQDSPDIRDVVTVHSNCCRFISAKVLDLNQVLREWAHFKISPSNETILYQWSKHVNCINSWHKDPRAG